MLASGIIRPLSSELGSIGSEKLAIMSAFIGTFVALGTGLRPVKVGGSVSGVNVVVKLRKRLLTKGFPKASTTELPIKTE